MATFPTWMRTAFPTINTALEFNAATGEARSGLINDLLGGQDLLPETATSPADEDVAMRDHLQLGMLHAACARHGLSGDTRLARCEHLLRASAHRWNVAPRFLAGPYLYLNDAVDGWPQTFLQSDDERMFVEANATGVAIYEAVWTLVSRVREMGLSHPSAPALLRQASATLASLRALHEDLASRLSREVYIDHIRHYYAGAPVAGTEWQGVNAGDQAWSMALDFLLGLAQRSSHYVAYAESRLPYLTPSHRTIVDRERRGRGWLDEAVDISRGRSDLRASLRELYDTLVDVTWAHHDLAVQFVDDATGTSGTDVHFLEETVRMRRDAPQLARLAAG